MIALAAAKKRTAGTGRAYNATYWIGLAASPTFVVMAWMTAKDGSRAEVCSVALGLLPINGMAWMYLLMSLFHVPPWLKLASSRPRPVAHPTPRN